MIKMNIGETIKLFREKSGMSQAELAKALDISGQTISSWERNRTEPNIYMIKKMAQLFNCDETELIYSSTDSQLQFDEIDNDMKEIMYIYSKLNDDQKKIVLYIMKFFINPFDSHLEI